MMLLMSKLYYLHCLQVCINHYHKQEKYKERPRVTVSRRRIANLGIKPAKWEMNLSQAAKLGKNLEQRNKHTFTIKPKSNPRIKQGMYKISLGDLFKVFPTSQMILLTLVSL